MHLKCAVFLHFPDFSNIFVEEQNRVSFLVEDTEILLLILTDVHKIIIMKMGTQSLIIIKEMIFMMKKWKRILGSALAVTTAAASVSSMSAGAVAFYSTSLEPPKGYTELDDKSFLARATNYSDAYTVYTDGKAESANLYIFEHYAFMIREFWFPIWIHLKRSTPKIRRHWVSTNTIRFRSVIRTG